MWLKSLYFPIAVSNASETCSTIQETTPTPFVDVGENCIAALSRKIQKVLHSEELCAQHPVRLWCLRIPSIQSALQVLVSSFC